MVSLVYLIWGGARYVAQLVPFAEGGSGTSTIALNCSEVASVHLPRSKPLASFERQVLYVREDVSTSSEWLGIVV